MGIEKDGVTGPLNGDVAEVLIFPSFLSDADCDSIYDNYFKPKYGLP